MFLSHYKVCPSGGIEGGVQARERPSIDGGLSGVRVLLNGRGGLNCYGVIKVGLGGFV